MEVETAATAGVSRFLCESVALPGYHMLTFTIDGARYVFVPLDLPSRRLAYTCSPVVSSAPVTATR